LPLAASSVVNGVFPDPARDKLLELFAAAINSELADAWTAATNGTPLATTSPIKSKLPLEPTPNVMLEQVNNFPVLALHRSGTAEYEELTLQIEQRKQQWLLHYFLSPLRADHMRQLSGVLAWVPAIIQEVIYLQGHPSYESGAIQFGFGGSGGLSTLRITGHEIGQARFADSGDEGPTYLACTVTLESTERGDWIDGAFPDLDGMILRAGVGGADEVLPDVIIGDSAVPLVYG
jgi:hypothetical protein